MFPRCGARPNPINGRPIGSAEWLALALPGEAETFERLRLATNTGRPCGNEAFVKSIEERLGRTNGARPRDRKPKSCDEDQNQLELFLK
ncbi:hypothetical protein LLG95_11260 [bacterium]|nr:hypothetical protein [bacterium]